MDKDRAAKLVKLYNSDELFSDKVPLDFIDEIEDIFFDSESIGNVIAARFICSVDGPMMDNDHCGIPTHRFCYRCMGVCGGRDTPEVMAELEKEHAERIAAYQKKVDEKSATN